MTQKQTDPIFELTHYKLEVKLVAAELDQTARRITVDEETKLWEKWMVKESDAWVAATVAATMAPTTVAQTKSLVKGDNITANQSLSTPIYDKPQFQYYAELWSSEYRRWNAQTP